MHPDRFPPPWKTRLSKLHIDLWRRHFPRTQLIALDGFDGGWNPNSDGVLMAYCRENGIGFRDDSMFCFPPPGTYALAVSVGSRIGTPEIALPLGGQVGETRRYVLGEVVVAETPSYGPDGSTGQSVSRPG